VFEHRTERKSSGLSQRTCISSQISARTAGLCRYGQTVRRNTGADRSQTALFPSPVHRRKNQDQGGSATPGPHLHQPCRTAKSDRAPLQQTICPAWIGMVTEAGKPPAFNRAVCSGLQLLQGAFDPRLHASSRGQTGKGNVDNRKAD